MSGVLYHMAYVGLLLWQLPQLVVALVMMPFMGRMRKVGETKWSTCYEGIRMRGGISLGPICYVSPSLSNDEAGIRHELCGHTYDSRIWGPLYLLVIGLPSLLNAAFDFTDCYWDFFTEKWANKHAGLKSINCKLYIE